MKKTKSTMPSMDKPKPNARLDLGDTFVMPQVSVGEPVTLTLRGTVTSLRQDQYGRSMEMTMTAFKAKGPSRLTDDMKDLRASRMVD